jgi:predicted acylesterase/phospholipase RssA
MQRVIGSSPIGRRRFLYAAGGATALLAGCSTPERGPAVPSGEVTHASVLGLPNERFFPLSGTEPMRDEIIATLTRRARVLGRDPEARDMPLNLLAVSGGGEDGAFGAGLLCAWSEHGGRPVFDVVTGISTGALTAPFAYLGSDYDPQLRAVYTEIKPGDVLKSRGMLAGALFDDALADNAPLLATISRYLTPQMQAALAKAYHDGRILLIGTTDLDAQVPVFWNIGAIAASDHPKALETIRRVLLASAAVPGAFPPTMFDVTLNGVAYQEMHVDGGAFAQAFLYPISVTEMRRQRMQKGTAVMPADAYIIRNARLDPNWASVRRSTLGIAGRAISTMIASSGMNDVMRIYNTTLRDNVAFHLAYIGSDFTMELPSPFDQGYMRALFDYGYQRSIHGYDWASKPPRI